jgi:hypothetical protein
VLLLAKPFVVLITTGATLLTSARPQISPSVVAGAAMTLATTVILAIVILHMGAS